MKLTTRRQIIWAVSGLVLMGIALFYTNQASGRLELGGQFEGPALTAIVTQISPNEYRADLTTAGRRCTGTTSVYGKRFESMVRFTPLPEGTAKSDCVIEAEWSEKGRIITLKEENCDAEHGATCSFNGKMNRIGRGNSAAKSN